MATMIFRAGKGVAQMTASGVDEPVTRKQIDTRAVSRLRKADNENLEEHEREPGKGKISYTGVHHDCVTRLDDERVLRILSALRGKLPKMEWLIFLALNFGTVEDERGILRFHPACREYQERLPTIDEVARHYRLTVRTVQEYDRRAREQYAKIEPAIGLLPGEMMEVRRKLGWIGSEVTAKKD